MSSLLSPEKRITKDTVLTNGSTVIDVYRSYRDSLERARASLAKAKTTPAADRLTTLRAYERNDALAVGRMQGFINAMTLLGLDAETLFQATKEDA